MGSKDLKAPFTDKIKKEYAEIRQRRLKRPSKKTSISLTQARREMFEIDWINNPTEATEFKGVKVLENYPLEDIVHTIDCTPIFQTWELHRGYPDILTDEVVGESATDIFKVAKIMLEKIVSEK